MAIWFNDLFTETTSPTNLSAHTSDSGATWVNVPFTGGDATSPAIYSAGGGCVFNGASMVRTIWRSSAVSPQADSEINANLYVYNLLSQGTGFFIKLAADGSAGYLAFYNISTTKWELYHYANGTFTSLAAESGTSVYADGNSPAVNFKAIASGSNQVITLTVNGATKIAFTHTAGSAPAPITAAGSVGMYFNSATAGAGNGLGVNSVEGVVQGSGAATAVTFTGPTAGLVGSPSSNFTVSANGTITGTVVVTPNDGGAGGTFVPTSVSISSGSPTGNFAYTAATSGAKTISLTNNGGLTNPASRTYTGASAATAVTLSGPTSGIAGSPSSNFTVGANGAISGTVVVTPSDGGAGGAFSPTSASISSGSPTGTFSYTAASSGAKTISVTNNASLTNPSSITYTASAAGGAVYPVTAKYRDKVRESSTSINATSITLGGAATGFRTFAAAYGSGSTKRIPIFYGDASNGPNWMTAYATFNGTNGLTVDEILSSSAGGTAAPTFTAGSKDVFVFLPAKAVPHKTYIDLADYAVDPTFTNDSTAGVQQAILDAYASGISEIRVPDGRFKIAGPLAGSGNCQLYIPNTREANPSKSIRFVGSGMPNCEQQGLRNVVPTNNGSIFESTITGSGSNPAVFGFEQANSGDAWPWNYTNVSFTDLCVRTFVTASGSANSMGALNYQFAAQIPDIHNVRIDVSRGLQDMVEPNTGSFGIITPPIDNHALLQMGTIVVFGYHHGIVANEHTDINRYTSVGNVNGLVLKTANHASRIGHYLAEWTRNSIVIDGNHDMHIGLYATEHNSGPNFIFASDVKYNSGNRKVSIMHSTVVVQGAGVNDAAFATNATTANLKVFVGAGAN